MRILIRIVNSQTARPLLLSQTLDVGNCDVAPCKRARTPRKRGCTHKVANANKAAPKAAARSMVMGVSPEGCVSRCGCSHKPCAAGMPSVQRRSYGVGCAQILGFVADETKGTTRA